MPFSTVGALARIATTAAGATATESENSANRTPSGVCRLGILADDRAADDGLVREFYLRAEAV
ncbi:hypothetical protein ACQEVS_02620 [Streptomyces sp. CA-181903]|uniref:hypothetical protein n=1 Tax=Streptomyces sp. CA-181903 TaxID=3240055 RepID=UPI003D9367E2